MLSLAAAGHARAPCRRRAAPRTARATTACGSLSHCVCLCAQADRVKRRLVVSNRRVKLEAATSELEPGRVVEGTVRLVKDYGAVVRLASGVEGLLHISQLSQVFVKNVSDCLQPGAAVRCVVIKVDADDGSISLSTKMLEGSPGEMLKNATAVYERAATAAAAS